MLTKQDFLAAKQCHKRLWLWKNDRGLAAPPDAAAQERIRVGRLVGELARKRHPEGRHMPPGSSADDEHRQTLEAIAQGAETLFEPGLVADGCHVRLDVLLKEPGGWVLIEVKSSKGTKPEEYVDEIAFQVLVARGGGLDVRRSALLCIDPDYVLDAEVDPALLFREIDVTEEVEAAIPRILEDRDALLTTLAGPMPEIESGKHCGGCPFTAHCFQTVPEDSVVYLPGVTTRKLIEFRSEGVLTVPMLDRATLNPRQALAFDATVQNTTAVGPGLAPALAQMAFPAAFVDFETVSECVPRVQGFRPYQSLPFQWSCHVVASTDGEAQHFEWLDSGGGDCREEFVATLLQAVEGTNGFVHYSSYEITQLRALANEGVPRADEALRHALRGSFDLLAVVKDHVAHPLFKGKTSIKSVLPVLCPGMGYEGLAIASGDAAQAAYVRMVTEGATHLRADLLEYCGLDTLAMVELYRALLRLAHG